MGLRLHLEKLGAGYATSPKVTINGLFNQAEQSRFILGPDWHENNALYLAGETPDSAVLKMPQIESILFPTKLSEVTLLHGGRGYKDPGDYHNGGRGSQQNMAHLSSMDSPIRYT